LKGFVNPFISTETPEKSDYSDQFISETVYTIKPKRRPIVVTNSASDDIGDGRTFFRRMFIWTEEA